MSRRHSSSTYQPLASLLMLAPSAPGVPTFVPSAPVPRPSELHRAERAVSRPKRRRTGWISLTLSLTVVFLAFAAANHLTGGTLSLWGARAKSDSNQNSSPPFAIKGAWRDIGAHALPVNTAPSDASRLESTRADEPAPPQTLTVVDTSSRDAGEVRPDIAGARFPPSEPLPSVTSPPERVVEAEPPATAGDAQVPTGTTRDVSTAPTATPDVKPSEAPDPEPKQTANTILGSPEADHAKSQAIITTTATESPPPAPSPAPAATAPTDPAQLAIASTAELASEPPTPPLPRRKPVWIAELNGRARAEPIRPVGASPHRPARPRLPDPEWDLLPNSVLFKRLEYASP